MENLVKRVREEPAVRADWPLCSRCASGLSRWGRSAAVLASLGALAIVGTIVLAVVGIHGPAVSAVFVAGACLIGLSIPVVHRARPERILHATATPDGSAVIVTDPNPDFAAAVRGGGSAV